MKQLQMLIEYASLGYDFSLTNIYGKEAVQMIKRYSYKKEGPVKCLQMYEHEKIKNETEFSRILQFLYDDIQEQEKTGKYYEDLE